MSHFFSKTIRLFKILFYSKWILSTPKQKKILVIDGASNPFERYFKKSDINILYRRGEEINIPTLFSCLLNFQLSVLGYYKKYIKFSKPKVILTNFDHYQSFYRISNLTKVKTFLIQRGKKTLMDGAFSIKQLVNKKNKKNFHVDYMFVHNKKVGNIYNSFTGGKIIEIGSFINNIIKKSNKKKKKEILFISSFKPHNSYLPDGIIEKKQLERFIPSSFFEKDQFVIKCLSEFAQNNNLKLNILGRNHGNNLKIEKEYYDNIIKEKYNFITSKKGKNSNKIVEEFDFVFTDFSTLGIENLVKNGKTGFVFCKPNKYKWFSARIGYFEKLKLKGPFWTTTTTNNKKEFNRVFNFVTKTNNKNWKKITKKYSEQLMGFDPGNKKFVKIVKQYLN